jgi:hypothetical protein
MKADASGLFGGLFLGVVRTMAAVGVIACAVVAFSGGIRAEQDTGSQTLRIEPQVTPEPPVENRGYYGSIAATIFDVGNNKRVATGVVWNYPTQAEADQAAIDRCKKAGGRGCKVVSTFYNGGCGYVSVGKKTRGVCWGTAATPEEARRQCASRGCSCDPAIGNCTNRPGS